MHWYTSIAFLIIKDHFKTNLSDEELLEILSKFSDFFENEFIKDNTYFNAIITFLFNLNRYGLAYKNKDITLGREKIIKILFAIMNITYKLSKDHHEKSSFEIVETIATTSFATKDYGSLAQLHENVKVIEEDYLKRIKYKVNFRLNSVFDLLNYYLNKLDNDQRERFCEEILSAYEAEVMAGNDNILDSILSLYLLPFKAVPQDLFEQNFNLFKKQGKYLQPKLQGFLYGYLQNLVSYEVSAGDAQQILVDVSNVLTELKNYLQEDERFDWDKLNEALNELENFVDEISLEDSHIGMTQNKNKKQQDAINSSLHALLADASQNNNFLKENKRSKKAIQKRPFLFEEWLIYRGNGVWIEAVVERILQAYRSILFGYAIRLNDVVETLCLIIKQAEFNGEIAKTNVANNLAAFIEKLEVCQKNIYDLLQVEPIKPANEIKQEEPELATAEAECEEFVDILTNRKVNSSGLFHKHTEVANKTMQTIVQPSQLMCKMPSL